MINYNKNIEDIILNKIKYDIEKLDKVLFKNRDQTILKPWKKQKRILITEHGIIPFKRYIYKFFNEETGKHEYKSLVDEHYFLNKKDKISAGLKLRILSQINTIKNYQDILDMFPKSKISKMTISNLYKYNFTKNTNKNQSKILLKKEQKLNINVDDCYVKIWENNIKIKKMIRVVSFNTGIDKVLSKGKRKVLENKRICYIIKDEKHKFNVDELANYIQEMGNLFYENFDEAELILGGDGAPWMKRLAHRLGAKYLLDFFHAAKYFKDIFLIKGKRFIAGNIAKFTIAKRLFKEGKHKELLEHLIACGVKIYSKIFKYFKKNWEGIINQGIENNIGVSAETDVAHLVKQSLGFGNRTYNLAIFVNILDARANQFNTTGHFR